MRACDAGVASANGEAGNGRVSKVTKASGLDPAPQREHGGEYRRISCRASAQRGPGSGYAYEGGMTHPDDDEDEHDPEHGDDRALEPHLAVLEREAHLAHIAHELGMARELLAHARAHV